MQSKNTKDALSNPTEATNEREEFEKNIGGSQPMTPIARSRVSPHIEGKLFGGIVYLDILSQIQYMQEILEGLGGSILLKIKNEKKHMQEP
jgi:hypothetical protein